MVMKPDYRYRLIAWVQRHDFWLVMGLVVVVCVLVKMKEMGLIFNN